MRSPILQKRKGRFVLCVALHFKNLSVGKTELGFIKRIEKGRIFTAKDLES